MPCAKEFICDTFNTHKIITQGLDEYTKWTVEETGFCKKLDFDGNELQLSTEFDADGNPDPTFPQHVYRVKFDSDYIRSNPNCKDSFNEENCPDLEPCDGNARSNPVCPVSADQPGSEGKAARYTVRMTRSHAVFGYVLDADGNPTTTPIVCENAKVNQLGVTEVCTWERSGQFGCDKQGEPCEVAGEEDGNCVCECEEVDKTDEQVTFIDQEICGYFVEPACGDNTVETREICPEDPSHQVINFTRGPWPFKGVGLQISSPVGYKYEIKKTRTVPSADPTTQAFACERTETDCGESELVPDCVNEISSCVQPMDSFGINVDQDLGIDPETGKKFVWPKHLQFNLSSLVYSSETETTDCNIPEMDCAQAYYYENNWSAGGVACNGQVIPGAAGGRKQHYVNGDTPYGSDYQFPDGFPTQTSSDPDIDGTPFRSRGVRCKVDLEDQSCNDNNRWGNNGKLGNPNFPPGMQFGGFSMCSPFALWEEKQRDDLTGDGNLKRVYTEACWFQGKGKSRIINATRIETEPVSVQLTAPDYQRTNARFVEYFVDASGLIPPPCYNQTDDDICDSGPPVPGQQGLEPIPCLPYALNEKVDSDGVRGRPQAMRLEGGWVCKNQKYDVYYICSRARRMTDYFLWLCCQTTACQCCQSACAGNFCNDASSSCVADNCDACKDCREGALDRCGALGTGSGYDQGDGGPGGVIGLQGCSGETTANNCGTIDPDDDGPSCGNAGYKCVNISAAVNLEHGVNVSPCPDSEGGPIPANQGFKKDLYIRVLLRCDPELTHYDPLTGEASRGVIRSELTLWSNKHPKFDADGNDDGLPTDTAGRTKGWEPVLGGMTTTPCAREDGGNSYCDTWDGFAYSDVECENCYNFVYATQLEEQFPSVAFPHPDSFCGCPGDIDTGDSWPCAGCSEDDKDECYAFNAPDVLPNMFNHAWSEGLMNIYGVAGIQVEDGDTPVGGVPAGGPINRSDYWRWGCDFMTVSYNSTPGRWSGWTGGQGSIDSGIGDPSRNSSYLFCKRDCNTIEERCTSPFCQCPTDCFCGDYEDNEDNPNCAGGIEDVDPELECPEDLFTREQRENRVGPGDRLGAILGVMDIRTTTEWQIETLPAGGGSSGGTSAFCNRHRYGFNKHIFPMFNLFGCNYRGLNASGDAIQYCDGSAGESDGTVDCDQVTEFRAPAPPFPSYRELIESYPSIKKGGIGGTQDGPQHFMSGMRNTTMQFAKPCAGWSKLVNELNYPVVPSGQYTYKEGYGAGNVTGEDYGADHESYTQPGDKTLGSSKYPNTDLPVGHATDRVDESGAALPHCTYTDMVVAISGGAYEDIERDARQKNDLGPPPVEQYKLSYIFTKECDANWYSIDSGHMKHQANGCAKKPTLTGGQVSFDFYDPTDQG
tara:strand:+ start:4795 stop:8961 length:4167 start_codon:yes stop_codon:yes gene_type:complete